MMDGRAEEAIEFYKKSAGANVTMLMRFKDSPDQQMCVPNSENKIMHAYMTIGETGIMISDGRNSGQPKFDGFALSIAAKTEGEADKLFGALGDGGEVTMPMSKTFFSPRFGMLKDRFGVHWMILVAQP
jgi:PhnB protein